MKFLQIIVIITVNYHGKSKSNSERQLKENGN